jgi:hypothetical protein
MGTCIDEGASFSDSGANTTTEVKENLVDVATEDQDGLLTLYPDVPALGCPFHTGDFRLAGIQNGFPVIPGVQDKRVFAMVGDVLMEA